MTKVLKKSYYNIHNHLITSNTRFLDSINTAKHFIWSAYKMGLAGVSISDHQSLAGHHYVLVAIKELKEEHPHMFDDFRVTFGDEIYLVDHDKAKQAKKTFKANQKNSTKLDYPFGFGFNHLVLTAKDTKGYEFLEKVNQKAWADKFTFGWSKKNIQTRLPTYKDWLEKAIKPYKDHVVASTACLGSELSKDILKVDKATKQMKQFADAYKKDHSYKNKSGYYRKKKFHYYSSKDLKTFLEYLVTTFGKKNVYFELMPSKTKQQTTVNKDLVLLSKKYGIKTIISTDSHYINQHDERLHQFYLEVDANFTRDVKDFYHYAHLFTFDELKKYFKADVLNQSAQNSLDLLKSIKPINFKQVKKDQTKDEAKTIKKTDEMAKKVNQKTKKNAQSILKLIQKASAEDNL